MMNLKIENYKKIVGEATFLDDYIYKIFSISEHPGYYQLIIDYWQNTGVELHRLFGIKILRDDRHGDFMYACNSDLYNHNGNNKYILSGNRIHISDIKNMSSLTTRIACIVKTINKL